VFSPGSGRKKIEKNIFCAYQFKLTSGRQTASRAPKGTVSHNGVGVVRRGNSFRGGGRPHPSFTQRRLHGGRSPVRKNIKEIQQRVAKGKKEKNGSEFIFGMASVMNTFKQNCIDNMH
tara:strand:- start:39 stop:392 length:354 start_codon:yes stop_codon:yes gene_type:complete